ncbi:hypothetical protein ECEC1870_4643, partial [Escherichia coli EC1870]
MLDHSGIGSR